MRLVAAIAAALALALPAAAAPPGAGVLVPGRSLGGLELGATKAEVEQAGDAPTASAAAAPARPGTSTTTPSSRGARESSGGTAARSRLFTIYQPLGWRTPKGLELNDPASRITGIYGPLKTVGCDGYSALVLDGRSATTAFYVLGDRLWAFGLSRPGVALCR